MNAIASISKITRKGKAMILAYDQGLEHGPSSDFNSKNVDPLNIIEIAKKGKFTALAVHKGIAEKYCKEIKVSNVPLILKLNGKTNLVKSDPVSGQDCSVKEALNLGASAVGYTIYLGSEFESEMIETFGVIEEEAHSRGIPVVMWAYIRGSGVKNPDDGKLMAYASRVGLELGADIVKIRYTGSVKELKWAVTSSGRCKMVIAGGKKSEGKKFLQGVKDVIDSGGIGVAVGRNVWQAKDPLKVSRKIREVIWE